jgi:hypothetical protein
MTKEELDSYLMLIMAMTLDVQRGGISCETYFNNMELMIRGIREELENVG